MKKSTIVQNSDTGQASSSQTVQILDILTSLDHFINNFCYTYAKQSRLAADVTDV